MKVISQIKLSFSGKYPYHKIPHRKHSGRQQDLKALRTLIGKKKSLKFFKSNEYFRNESNLVVYIFLVYKENQEKIYSVILNKLIHKTK